MKFENATLYRQVLSRSVPFNGVDASIIDSLLEHGLVLSAKEDELVFYEHMRGGLGLYVILDGEIEIYRTQKSDNGDEHSSEMHLATLTPGQCFGEYSLLDGQNTSAAAKAMVDSKLFLLSRGEFEKVIQHDAEAARTIYRNLLLFLIDRLRKYP